MENYKINHELDQYEYAEGIEFIGLMPKVMEKIGLTTGTSDKSTKFFGVDAKGSDSLEVIDIEEIMNQSEDGGNEGGENQGGENQGGENQGGENQGGENQGGENQGGENQGGENQGGENQGGENQGGENQGGESGKESTTETVATWDYIHDEESWNASYQSGGLKDYYEWCDGGATKPYKEDLWNTTELRAAGWNEWVKDENNEPILDENGYITYTDDGTKNGTPCVRCWLGALNAPEAEYPWVVVTPPKPFTGKIKFVYNEGEPVYPFGNEVKTFNNGFGCVSIPKTLGEEYLLDEQGNTTFIPSKLVITLIPE